ncbi:MAG: hypothetical protein GY711_11340 [bacterium]|nr:hypothetical protein [bacterium]
MVWSDRWRQASFREVPFQLDAAEIGGGRRAEVHEFPFGELPHTEDLGRKRRMYRFDAYLLGEDYDRELEDLLAALEGPGPGILVHPHLGSLAVFCTTFTVSQSSLQGRMARVSLEFTESGRRRFVSTRPDVVGAADESAAAAKEAAQAEFGDQVVAGGPGFVTGATAGEVSAVGRELQALDLNGPAGEVSEFLREAARLSDQALDQVARPFEFAQEWGRTLDRIEHAVDSRRAALEVYLGLYDSEPATSGGAGIWQQAANRNARAVHNLTQVAAGAQAVRMASRIEWESFEEATDAAKRISDAMSGLLGSVADSSYEAVRALLEKLAAAVPPPGQQLPRVAQLTPAATTSSLVLAYSQDGDVSGEAALVERNRGRIRHPGFVTGGEPVEVLVRA